MNPLDSKLKKILGKKADLDAVQDLIDQGADVDFGLRESSYYGHVDVVELFLNCGACVRSQGDFALRTSSEYGHVYVVKLLLDYGADIHARDDDSLVRSAQNGHFQVVSLLLDRGANVHAQNDRALSISIQRNYIEIVSLLLNKGATIHDDSLTDSVLNCGFDMSALLLKYGANINTLKKKSCLWPCATSIRMFNLLMSYGAKIDVNDVFRESVGLYNPIDILQFLLNRGADIHLDNDYALRYYSRFGALETVRLLLDHGADIHAYSDYSLRHSVQEGHYHTVMLLLNRGANIHIWNDSPLTIASELGDLEMVKLLMAQGADARTITENTLGVIINRNYITVFKLLLEYGAPISSKIFLFSPAKLDGTIIWILGLYNIPVVNDMSPMITFFETFGLFRRHVHTLEQLCRKSILIYNDQIPLGFSAIEELIMQYTWLIPSQIL
jgi:ankyrin repeat protein